MVPVWQLQQHWAAVGLAHCCGYFGAIVLVFISSILLVCLVIHFYPHMRTLLYREGVCTITDAVYTTQYSCFCGQLGCKSFYPCLIVYVLVNSSLDGLDQRIKEQLRWPVPVYQDDWQQIRVYKSADDTTERVSWEVISVQLWDELGKMDEDQKHVCLLRALIGCCTILK